MTNPHVFTKLKPLKIFFFLPHGLDSRFRRVNGLLSQIVYIKSSASSSWVWNFSLSLSLSLTHSFINSALLLILPWPTRGFKFSLPKRESPQETGALTVSMSQLLCCSMDLDINSSRNEISIAFKLVRPTEIYKVSTSNDTVMGRLGRFNNQNHLYHSDLTLSFTSIFTGAFFPPSHLGETFLWGILLRLLLPNCCSDGSICVDKTGSSCSTVLLLLVFMPSSSPSSSSTSSSSSRKRVTFMDTDTVISLPSEEQLEASETRPQVTPPATPPTHSPNSTASTLSTSGPYTPPPNSNSGILIQGQDYVTTNFDGLTPTPSDAIVLLEAMALDTYKPHDLPLHKCLITSNPTQWDMLTNPQTHPRPHALDQFGRDFMTHHAFPDLVSKIRINCDILPWPIIIDIEQEVDRSPRIEVVFESIYLSLWKLASSVDFENETTERQHRIQKEYRRRCRHLSIPGDGDGLRRIDFLEGQTMFLGLSPGHHVDEWHLHVGKEYESFAQWEI